MSDYKIKSIGKVDFRTYKDVIRVIAIKERGFWTSLFSSPKEAYFILSDESPLYGAVNAAKSNESIWDVSESSFTVERVNGTFYSVEKSIALYENKKAKRIAETKRKADEAKKAKEQQTQRKKEETAKRIDEAFKKATVQKVRLSDFQVSVDENASFSDQMAGIAGNVNLCFVTGNKQGVTDNLVKLYTKVQGYNSHLLKNVEAKDGQIVGLAFIKMALYFTNGNFLVNEIAAQNAYYCIAKNFLIAKNTYALPALFTLFVKRPQTLVDELYNPNFRNTII
jgi:23S rRNA pseudoU1915 N3-methylase RlmH